MNRLMGYYKRLKKDINQSYVKYVAKAYKNAKEDRALAYSWEVLAKHVETQCQPLFRQLSIAFTVKNPYKTFEEMKHDISQNKHLTIFVCNSTHPLWTKRQNILFRLFHDYFGHYHANQPFTFEGELQVYKHHLTSIPQAAKTALMTESVGELCYYFYYKKYVDRHKICDLNLYDPTDLGAL